MAPPSSRKGLLNIKPHMETARDRLLAPISVNLASNESALGPGTLAIEAGKASMAAPERYAEDAPVELAGALGRRFLLDTDRIVVGHGSDDLLARLARAYLEPGSELLRSRNGYLKVPNYAHANDATPVNASDVDFKASVDGLLSCITPRTRMVYVANPDNPSGTYLTADELAELHQAIPSDVMLVVDAAYEEYVDAPDFMPAADLVDRAENVVMTRTFSKIFGLAGLRVGWLYGPAAICDAVRRIGLTFPISVPALASATAALADRAHTEMVFRQNRKLRTETAARLAGLGLRVFPSQGNFLLVEFPGTDVSARLVHDRLRARGIAVRRFVSPAFDRCIRITLGHESEVRLALEHIDRFLGGGE